MFCYTAPNMFKKQKTVALKFDGLFFPLQNQKKKKLGFSNFFSLISLESRYIKKQYSDTSIKNR